MTVLLLTTPEPTASRPAEDLVAHARAGDPDALGALYDAHAAALFRLAQRVTGSAADAEDIVHDLFVGLPEALAHYDERGHLGGWLARATTRLCLMRLRTVRRRREDTLHEVHDGLGLLAAAVPEPTVLSARTLDPQSLARALGRLPVSLRVVFVLRVVEELSHEDIAQALGITPGASRVRLTRALGALRAALALPGAAASAATRSPATRSRP